MCAATARMARANHVPLDASLPQKRFAVMLGAAMDLTPTNRRVRVGAVTLHVQEWGAADDGRRREIAVFAHPTGFLGPVWLPIIRRLRAAGFRGRILTYDQRGHGLSSKPDDGYHWQSFVDDARELFRLLEIENAVGIGHSAGATALACSAALDHNRLRRLVMIDPILFEPAFHERFRSEENTMAKRTRSRRLVWSSHKEIFDS
jgi:pimeloyl-ACP methyl ester carboxylesterase